MMGTRGNPPAQHLVHAVVHPARPQADLGFGQVFLQEREHAGRVRDVADIDRLPRRAQDDAGPALVAGAGCGRQRGRERGLDEGASFHRITIH
jgi:hypothetical protein